MKFLLQVSMSGSKVVLPAGKPKGKSAGCGFLPVNDRNKTVKRKDHSGLHGTKYNANAGLSIRNLAINTQIVAMGVKRNDILRLWHDANSRQLRLPSLRAWLH